MNRIDRSLRKAAVALHTEVIDKETFMVLVEDVVEEAAKGYGRGANVGKGKIEAVAQRVMDARNGSEAAKFAQGLGAVGILGKNALEIDLVAQSGILYRGEDFSITEDDVDRAVAWGERMGGLFKRAMEPEDWNASDDVDAELYFDGDSVGWRGPAGWRVPEREMRESALRAVERMALPLERAEPKSGVYVAFKDSPVAQAQYEMDEEWDEDDVPEKVQRWLDQLNEWDARSYRDVNAKKMMIEALMFSRDKTASLIVEEVEGELKAAAAVTRYQMKSRWVGGDEMYGEPEFAALMELTRLGTRESGYGTGMMRRVVDVALEAADEFGYGDDVTLDWESIPESSGFYEHLGFGEIDQATTRGGTYKIQVRDLKQWRADIDDYVTCSKCQVRILAATEAAARGDMRVRNWYTLARQGIKDVHIAQYIAGRGGRGRMTQKDWGRLGGLLNQQYHGFLDGFMVDLASGEMTEAMARHRMGLFMRTGFQGYGWGRVEAAVDAGFTTVSWEINWEIENCEDCVANYELGEVSMEDGLPFDCTPGGGCTVCISNCGCGLEFGGQGEGTRVNAPGNVEVLPDAHEMSEDVEERLTEAMEKVTRMVPEDVLNSVAIKVGQPPPGWGNREKYGTGEAGYWDENTPEGQSIPAMYWRGEVYVHPNSLTVNTLMHEIGHHVTMGTEQGWEMIQDAQEHQLARMMQERVPDPVRTEAGLRPYSVESEMELYADLFKTYAYGIGDPERRERVRELFGHEWMNALWLDPSEMFERILSGHWSDYDEWDW